MEVLRFSRIIPLHPEVLPEEGDSALHRLRVRERQRNKGALYGQCVYRETRWSFLRDGDIEVLRPALTFGFNPLVLVYGMLDTKYVHLLLDLHLECEMHEVEGETKRYSNVKKIDRTCLTARRRKKKHTLNPERRRISARIHQASQQNRHVSDLTWFENWGVLHVVMN